MKLEEQNNNIDLDEPQKGGLLNTKPKTKKPSLYKVILFSAKMS